MLHVLLLGLGCLFICMFIGMRWFGLWMSDTTPEKAAVLEVSWMFLVYALLCFGLSFYL
jgi:predicted small integral membrane protein